MHGRWWSRRALLASTSTLTAPEAVAGRASAWCRTMGDMRDELLDGSRLEQLRAARLSYPEVGATRGELPAGYRHLRREVTLGAGTERFEHATDVLLHWDMQ